MQKAYRHILIVRTDRIGDVILTLPMAQALRRLYPEARIAMLIRRYTAELVEDHPCVDHFLLYDDGERQIPFFRLVGELRAAKFDLVFHTHPRSRVALMTFLAGIPVRVGTGYRWYSFLFNRKVYEHRKDARRHELEYNLNLLGAVGASIDPASVPPSVRITPEATSHVRSMLASLGVPPEARLVILHPGSGASARDWPAANFGLLASKIKELPSVRVLITGGKGEDGLVRAVRDAAGGGTVEIVDRLNLHQFAALIHIASLFVANSTGPLHIAAAVGTPVVGFYPQVTPLSASRWGPYTAKKTIFTPAGKPADCAECLAGPKRSCACMETIGVDAVADAVVALLGHPQPVGAHA